MGFPFLLPAPRLAKFMIREYRTPIAISSKNERLFRLQTIKRCEDSG